MRKTNPLWAHYAQCQSSLDRKKVYHTQQPLSSSWGAKRAPIRGYAVDLRLMGSSGRSSPMEQRKWILQYDNLHVRKPHQYIFYHISPQLYHIVFDSKGVGEIYSTSAVLRSG